MKKIVSKINDATIFVFLVLVYLSAFGISSVFLHVAELFSKKQRTNSYWQDCHIPLQRDYFLSAY